MTVDNRPEFQQLETSIENNGRNLRFDLGISLVGFGVTTGELRGPFSLGVPLELTTETAILATTIAVTYAAMMVAVYRMARHGLLYRERDSLTERPAPVTDMFKTMLLPSRFRKAM